MLEIIALLSILGALILLYMLSKIDMEVQLLPNELVLGFAASGLIFHLSTLFFYFDVQEMLLGALIGGGILYLIRAGANLYYGEDTLGLGDVKLIAAGGIWLGPEYVLIGMTIGAFLGFLHGGFVAIKTSMTAKIKVDLNRLSVPAGPGFCLGLIFAAIYRFKDVAELLIP